MNANTVQFNLKNVHYALMTIGEDGAITFAAPVAVPGAVTLTLDQQGNMTPFYADGVTYFKDITNNGYAGDLEVARMPDQMLQDVWGFVLNTENVITENADAKTKPFALLYQIDGDANDDFYCLYNCSGTRPGIGGATNTDTKTIHARKSTISAIPLPDGRIMARTTNKTETTIKDNWFKKVYEAA